MKGVLRALIVISVVLLLSAPAFARPKEAPPAGKIWFEVSGVWMLLGAPPSDGPYLWIGGKWIIDTSGPPARNVWVPGQWGSGVWIAGHWKALKSPGPRAVWMSGYWRGNKWVTGQWKGKHPKGKRWAPGHRGKRGRWVPGHWK